MVVAQICSIEPGMQPSCKILDCCRHISQRQGSNRPNAKACSHPSGAQHRSNSLFTSSRQNHMLAAGAMRVQAMATTHLLTCRCEWRWLDMWHVGLVSHLLLCRQCPGMLSSHGVNQVDAQPLGILKALGIDGRHKEVKVVWAAAQAEPASYEACVSCQNMSTLAAGQRMRMLQ